MIEKTTIVTDAETPEAFAEDRLEFWQWFTKMVVRAAIVVVSVLVVLAFFTL